MVTDIAASIFTSVKCSMNESKLPTVLYANVRARDHVILARGRGLPVSAADVASADIETVQCCVCQGDANALAEYNAGIRSGNL